MGDCSDVTNSCLQQQFDPEFLVCYMRVQLYVTVFHDGSTVFHDGSTVFHDGSTVFHGQLGSGQLGSGQLDHDHLAPMKQCCHNHVN